MKAIAVCLMFVGFVLARVQTLRCFEAGTWASPSAAEASGHNHENSHAPAADDQQQHCVLFMNCGALALPVPGLPVGLQESAGEARVCRHALAYRNPDLLLPERPPKSSV